MTPEDSNNYQNIALALILGLALTPAVGFGTGLWVTKGHAERQTNDAVLSAKSAICVAQFANAAHYRERLKEYLALDYSAKRTFLEKGGWAKMPGEEKAGDTVRDDCSGKIETLSRK